MQSNSNINFNCTDPHHVTQDYMAMAETDGKDYMEQIPEHKTIQTPAIWTTKPGYTRTTSDGWIQRNAWNPNDTNPRNAIRNTEQE